MVAFAWAVIYVTLLVRFGVLALAVAVLVSSMMFNGGTSAVSWTAWHEQPALIVLVIVGLLAAYGFWAATAGRPLFGDGQAERAREP